jgi:hypothetical protein
VLGRLAATAMLHANIRAGNRWTGRVEQKAGIAAGGSDPGKIRPKGVPSTRSRKSTASHRVDAFDAEKTKANALHRIMNFVLRPRSSASTRIGEQKY